MRKKRAIFRVGLWFSIWLLGGCGVARHLAPTGTARESFPVVRVLLSQEGTEYTISSSGKFTARGVTSSGGEVVYYCSQPVHLKYRRGRWELAENNRVVLESDLMRLTVSNKDADDCLRLDDQPYPGALYFHPPREGGQPRVVNRVHVDDYLLGVLPPELGKRTKEEYEAIKAQAVAARTYALFHLGQYKNADYDLRDDHLDQVYVGLKRPDQRVRRAVVQTAGEVLRQGVGGGAGGDLIETYYHSTCGGSTDDITSVWGKPSRPHLVATKDDTFCQWSKYYTWTENWTNAELKENLNNYLKTADEKPFSHFDEILSLRTEGQTAGGRVVRLVIQTDRGRWELATDRIRWALGRPSTGGPILQSARFEIRPEFSEDGELLGLTAYGGGYGHGVGMCQCGMIGRARAGQDYRRILTHYYPGVTLEKTY